MEESEQAEVDQTPPSPVALEDGDTSGDDTRELVPEALERLGRDTSTLVLRELQLAAARNRPALHRLFRDIVAAVAIAVALLTTFAFLNVAADRGLSLVVADWLAPLILSAVWIVVGVVLFAFVLRPRVRQSGVRRWWMVLAADQEISVEVCERARDDARQAMRASLGDLTEALSGAAGEQLAQAASGAAGGVVDAGEELLDRADEITDAIEEAVPGGSVVNKAVDLALVPGRFAVKVSRTILVRRDRSAPD